MITREMKRNFIKWLLENQKPVSKSGKSLLMYLESSTSNVLDRINFIDFDPNKDSLISAVNTLIIRTVSSCDYEVAPFLFIEEREKEILTHQEIMDFLNIANKKENTEFYIVIFHDSSKEILNHLKNVGVLNPFSYESKNSDLIATIVINKSIMKNKKDNLMKKIDLALESRNKDLFMQLTKELHKLNEQQNIPDLKLGSQIESENISDFLLSQTMGVFLDQSNQSKDDDDNNIVIEIKPY